MPAKFVTRQGDRFCIQLADDSTIQADVVVNCMGRWVNDIESDLELPAINMGYDRWRLLAFFHSGYPDLDRVITVEPADHHPVAAIPHDRRCVILGCDVPVETLSSPEDLPVANRWRPIDFNHPQDRLLYETLADHFTILKNQPQSSRNGSIYSFSGIHGRPILECQSGGKRPYGSVNTHENPQVQNYFALEGGSATTACIDSLEIAEILARRYMGVHLDRAEVVDTIGRRLPSRASIGPSMVWELNHSLARP